MDGNLLGIPLKVFRRGLERGSLFKFKKEKDVISSVICWKKDMNEFLLQVGDNNLLISIMIWIGRFMTGACGTCFISQLFLEKDKPSRIILWSVTGISMYCLAIFG